MKLHFSFLESHIAFITIFPPRHTPYPKTSPLGLKGAFSRLLETASEGPALGQWWLRWRGAGGAGTHSILNLLAELGRPRTEPESQIWGMPWRDGWAWGLGGQGEALAHPKTPSCLCSYANASRHFDAPQVCCLSPSFQSTPPCLTNCTYTHTHTHFHPLSWTAFFSPQSLPLSDLSSFFPHCVCFIWCQHIKVPNHQSKRVRDFFWGPSIQLRQPYARKATANHNVSWFLLLHKMKLSVLSSQEVLGKVQKSEGKKINEPTATCRKTHKVSTITQNPHICAHYLKDNQLPSHYPRFNKTFATSLSASGRGISTTKQLIRASCIQTW